MRRKNITDAAGSLDAWAQTSLPAGHRHRGGMPPFVRTAAAPVPLLLPPPCFNSGRLIQSNQIDGIVYLNDTPFLIECKDKEVQGSEVITKLRFQLERRPPATLAGVFIAGNLTSGARMVSEQCLPHRITLWERGDIDKAVATGNSDPC
ncbi:MAG: hypothetical protein WDN30_13080 [Pararobbsia sp.]